MTDDDLHYLRSILATLRSLRDVLKPGVTLSGEVLADNIDWLDCYIERLQRMQK